MPQRDGSTGEGGAETSRRGFLTWLTTALMGGGLIAAYGSLAAFFGRFFYPARPQARSWLFVREIDRIAPGASLVYRLPGGSPVNIMRRSGEASAEAFRALSSTCPHLGCQVHWEAHNERFFCPCHNGIFTPEGVATSGPPAEAGQSLPSYPLKVSGGLLYIEAPTGEERA